MINCKRKYDKNNRLIHELNRNEETIIRYDENGNIIYSKNWNIKSGDIWFEYYQEFDSNNNLIHFKDTENLVEYWIEYNNFNNPILKRYSNGEYTRFEYDEFNNLIREIDENGIVIEYENIYEEKEDD